MKPFARPSVTRLPHGSRVTDRYASRGLTYLAPSVLAAMNAASREVEGLSPRPPDGMDETQPEALNRGVRGLLMEAAAVLDVLPHHVAAGWCRWLVRLIDARAPKETIWQAIETARAALPLWTSGLPECPEIMHAAGCRIARTTATTDTTPRLSDLLHIVSTPAMPATGDRLQRLRVLRHALHERLSSPPGEDAHPTLLELARLAPPLRAHVAILLAVDRVDVQTPESDVRWSWWRDIDRAAAALIHAPAAPLGGPPTQASESALEWLLPRVHAGDAAATILTRVLPQWTPPSIAQRRRFEDGLRGFTLDTWTTVAHAFREEVARLATLAPESRADAVQGLGRTMEGMGLPVPSAPSLSSASPEAAMLLPEAWAVCVEDPTFWIDHAATDALRRRTARDHARQWHQHLQAWINAWNTSAVPPEGLPVWLAAVAELGWESAPSASMATAWRYWSEHPDAEGLPVWLSGFEAWLLALAESVPDPTAAWHHVPWPKDVAPSPEDGVYLPLPTGLPEPPEKGEAATSAPAAHTPRTIADLAVGTPADLLETLWSEIRQRQTALVAWLRMPAPTVASRRNLLASLEVVQGALDHLPERTGREVLDQVVSALQQTPSWQPIAHGLRTQIESACIWIDAQPEMAPETVTTEAWRALCKTTLREIMAWASQDQATPAQWKALRALHLAARQPAMEKDREARRET